MEIRGGAMDSGEANVFLGSSKEAQSHAEVIQEILFSLGSNVTAWWSDNAFPVGSTFIESLTRLTTLTDASLLIASEDDITNRRGQLDFTPRDNVIFEHGMFSAAHGRERSAIATLGEPKLPTDLLGVVVIRLHRAQSTGDFKERNRAEIRKWYEALKKTAAVPTRLDHGTREQLAIFMREMDEIWRNFDAAWDLIHLQNYPAEVNLALALDEFFQQYHSFFVAIQASETPVSGPFIREAVNKANASLLKAWENVAQGKMSLAEEDLKEADLKRVMRRHKNIKDQAAYYLKHGKNPKVGSNERLTYLKKSVELINDLLRKAVEERGA